MICFGVNGIYAFMGHFFFSNYTATLIGWPAGNPFQLEVAFADLALGAICLLNAFFKGSYRIASTLSQTIFPECAGLLHIHEMIVKKNFNTGNTLILLTDLFVPLLAVILLVLTNRTNTKTGNKISA